MKLLALLLKFLGCVSPRLAVKIAWPLFCTPLSKRKSPSLNENKLVAQAQHSHIDCDTYKIAAFKWSPAQQSSECLTILLTHGWAGESFDFSNLIEQLLLQGHTIIAVDSPAHGASTGSRTTLKANAEALLKVAENSEPIDVLISHSFGTMVSTYALSLAYRQGVLSQVKKLILIAGPNKLTDVVLSFAQTLKLSESVVNIFHEKIERIVQRPITAMNVIDFLENYSGATLVVHDRKDRVVAYREAEEIASNTNAELFATEGLGHRRILGAATVIEKILRFIK